MAGLQTLIHAITTAPTPSSTTPAGGYPTGHPGILWGGVVGLLAVVALSVILSKGGDAIKNRGNNRGKR